VIERNNHSTFSLNNSGGDTVRLLDEQANFVDEFTYESDPGEDKSFGRVPDGAGDWFVSENPTKGEANFQPTVAQNPTSSPTSTNSPTPTVETIEEANCLINSPTDSSGNTLTNVKIYIDGTYIHHYTPEELIFGPGCFCDQENKVPCDFGQHKITLEKSGFESESIEQEFYSGMKTEISLVLEETKVSLESTSTPTLTSTSTIVLATTSARFTSTEAGKVLGEEASESAFYPLGNGQATPSSSASEVDGGGQKPFWPWLILGVGAVFLFSSAFLVYNRLK